MWKKSKKHRVKCFPLVMVLCEKAGGQWWRFPVHTQTWAEPSGGKGWPDHPLWCWHTEKPGGGVTLSKRMFIPSGLLLDAQRCCAASLHVRWDKLHVSLGFLVEKWRPHEEPPVHAGGSNAEEDLKTQRCYEWSGFKNDAEDQSNKGNSRKNRWIEHV